MKRPSWREVLEAEAAYKAEWKRYRKTEERLLNRCPPPDYEESLRPNDPWPTGEWAHAWNAVCEKMLTYDRLKTAWDGEPPKRPPRRE